MKKIIVTTTYYVAEDGKRFLSEERCRKYESPIYPDTERRVLKALTWMFARNKGYRPGLHEIATQYGTNTFAPFRVACRKYFKRTFNIDLYNCRSNYDFLNEVFRNQQIRSIVGNLKKEGVK